MSPVSSTPSSSGPTVSVVVATRNRQTALARCLAGIAAQTYQALEVIVSDDGSNEETRASYADLCPALDGRITWLASRYPDGPGTGPAAVRNRGLRAASGAFVAFCDDDDEWIREDHLSTAVSALEALGADFYFTDLKATRDGRESPDYKFFPELSRLTRGSPVRRSPDVFAPDLDAVLQVVGGSVIHPDAWVVRKTLLDEAGEFWERLWFPEDYNLMMRVLDRAQKILFRPDPCVDYRLPVSGAHSLRTSTIEKILQELLAAQHVRVTSNRPIVARHARSREAWAFRRVAGELRASGRASEARVFAWQGFLTFPTLGALRGLLRW